MGIFLNNITKKATIKGISLATSRKNQEISDKKYLKDAVKISLIHKKQPKYIFVGFVYAYYFKISIFTMLLRKGS